MTQPFKLGHLWRLIGFVFALMLCYAPSALSQQLTISSPSNGATVVPGGTVTVTVSVTGGSVSGVEIVGQNIGASGVVNAVPYMFNLLIPAGLIGLENLTALGTTGSGQTVMSTPLTIDIESTVQATSLVTNISQIQFGFAGDQFPLRVVAALVDGSQLDVTQSTQITFSSGNTATATVDSTALVTATGAGTTFLTVTYAGQSANVPVTVPAKVVGDLNGDGKVTADDLRILEAFVGMNAVGPFDARDLNGDGIINSADVQILKNLCGSACSSVLSTTATLLTSTVNPSLLGQSIGLTATVSPAGTTIPTGNVVFLDGLAQIGTVNLDSTGKAIFQTGSLSVGSHTLAAGYSGDLNFSRNTSNLVAQVVSNSNNIFATTTALQSSQNTSTVGQAVTFTATVVSSGVTPVGTVTFFDGTTSLGTGTVNGNGVATLSTSALAIGLHSITASYGGGTNFSGSSSTAITQVVNSPTPATAQYAPATNLSYSDSGSGDIVMTRVLVLITTPSTYYETMGWNAGAQGGGYTGIQDSGNLGKNYIFSIFDANSVAGPATAVYSDPSGVVTRFTELGGGIHYLNYNLQWQLNQWYRLVSRTWDYNGQTYFAMWSYDETGVVWTHHVTFAYPLIGVRFSGSTYSFLEDFGGTGQNFRRDQLNDGWKRSAPNAWTPYSSALFTLSTVTGQYSNAYDAGVQSGAYYMQTGSNTTPSLNLNSNLTLPFTANSPSLSIGRIQSLSASYDQSLNQITVSWATDPTVSPQFGYHIDLFNNSALSGSTIISQSDTAPDLRSIVLTPPAPGNTSYYVRISMTDIFDQAAIPVSVTVAGIGSAGSASALPASLSFGSALLGATTTPQAVTFSNTGTGILTLSNIAVSGDFSLVSGGTCTSSSSLVPSAVCTVGVAFSPTASGQRTGNLTFTDNATGGTQIVALTGTGSDFSLVAASGSSTTSTVTAGQAATYDLSLVPAGGFNLPVTISCSGAPSLATCNVSPSVTPSGSSSTAVTVTVNTTARSIVPTQQLFGPPDSWLIGLRLLTVLVLLLAALGWPSWAQERGSASDKAIPFRAGLVVLAMLIALGLTMGACGASGGYSAPTPSNPGTPTGTYQLTVTMTATSGVTTLKHATTLTLNVN
jgi:hypothetical protein